MTRSGRQPASGAAGGEAALAAIRKAVAALAPGELASYGEVARRAGMPGRARLVARALRLAPDAARLPWHRVLAAGGRIAFAPGSEGFLEQRDRLRAEGHRVDERGRVADWQAAAAQDLDAALWRLPPEA